MSSSSIQPPGNPNTSSPQLWQGERTADGITLVALWRKIRQFFWAACLLGALVLFAWLIWLLLLAPKRTPLVVLSAAPYSWPLPPNDWASEDFEKLSALDGETITLRGSGDPVFRATDFFERLDREIKAVADQHLRLPLIVWVSLHGVAENATNSLHLVPPNASPTDPDSWIELDGLLDRLENVDPDRNVLLVLDCNRMLVNWNIGLTVNRFADRVQTAYRQRIVNDNRKGDLAVLLSAGPEEQSHSSAHLGGSVFGHYFHLGLAGAADRQSGSGNNDGWVDIAELFGYVQSNVKWWTANSLGKSQIPMLLSRQSESRFRVARSLHAKDLNPLIGMQAKVGQGPTISGTRLDAAWRFMDEAREKRLYEREPIAFRNLEHELLWLEQLSESGNGYQTLAQRTAEKIEDQIKSIEDRISRLAQSRSYLESYSLISGNRPPLPRQLRLHSLPLAEFFGTQDVQSSLALRDRMAEFASAPSAVGLAQTKSELEKGSKSLYGSAQFIKMLDRYQTPRLWQRDEMISKLIRLRTEIEDFATPRDQAGFPADLRVHHWNRALLGQVDDSRRELEDSVLLSDSDRLGQALTQTQSRFASTLEVARLATQASALCDRAMAVTPYYAQWIAHPDRAVAPEVTKQRIDSEILPLIRNALELASLLSDLPNPAADATTIVDKVNAAERFSKDNIDAVLAALERELLLAKNQLLLQSNTNRLETIGELQAFLSVPLIEWESRRDLRNALSSLQSRVQQNLDSVAEDESETMTEEPAAGLAAKIASWQQHPLTLLLQQDDDDGNDSTLNLIPHLLDSIDQQLRRGNQAPTIREQRSICSVAASQLRTAAPIWFPATEQDPIAKLQSLDIESLLIWHCQRVIEDCWGPAGGDRSFYDLAASDYCDAVAEMDRWRAEPGVTFVEAAEVRAAKSRLEAGRRFLPEWITTIPGRTVQLDPNDDVASVFSVTSDASAEFDSPTGTATVVVRSEKGRVDVESIAPSDAVSLPGSGTQYEVRLPADVVRSGESLKAQTVFRGHEYGGTLAIESLGGVTVDVNPPRYEKSEVTLNGPWDELSVVFVIDCSASMNEMLQGDPEQTQSRIEVAKAALQEMLFNLGLRRNVRVGIHAFGNRLGWSVDEPVRSLARPDYTGQIAPDLQPGQDVEALLSLSDFDLATAKNMVPQISQLKPWGQSPLYLAVKESIEEFTDADSNAERHVIVITDGANYQFTPASADYVAPTTDNDVRRAWAMNQVPVHILGLGMDQGSQREASLAFDQLSRDTGGRFQSLSRSTDLAKALRELLAPGMYRLLSYQRDEQPEIAVTLGTPTQVIPAPETPELFGLQYDGRASAELNSDSAQPMHRAVEPIVLEGGEAYQLYVNESGSDIFDFPYDDNVVAIADLVTDQQAPSAHAVRLHRPFRDPTGAVTFPISWQRRDANNPTGQPLWRATRRPSAVWVRIQPIGADGNFVGEEYVYYDASFEAGQPVPVMNAAAGAWPKSATRAKISLWSRPPDEENSIELLPPAIELLPPAIETDRQAIAGQAVSDRLNLTIDLRNLSTEPFAVTPGVSVRIDPLGTQYVDGIAKRRYVVEMSDANIPVSSIKLTLADSLTRRLTRIIRQYDSRLRLSVHTFYYESRQNESPSEIRISNRDHEIDGAWRLADEFVEVAIPDAGGLLPIGSFGSR